MHQNDGVSEALRRAIVRVEARVPAEYLGRITRSRPVPKPRRFASSRHVTQVLSSPSLRAHFRRALLWSALAVAGAGLLFHPLNAIEHWALYWVATSFSAAAVAIFRTLPLPALALALGSAGWGGSLLKIAGLPLPNAVFSALTAATLWLILHRYGRLPAFGRHVVMFAAIATGFLSPLSLTGIQVDGGWLLSFFTVNVLLTERMFRLRSIAAPGLALVFVSFVPFTAGLVINMVAGIQYGSPWSITGNLLASLAPLGCVVRAARLARNNQREQEHNDPARPAVIVQFSSRARL